MGHDHSPLVLIKPQWPAPSGVMAGCTTRLGGMSQGCYRGFNLAHHVGDEADTVLANRQRLMQEFNFPQAPQWLNQVHGIHVHELNQAQVSAGVISADASFTRQGDQVCVVLTADCLPLLVCDETGSVVAAIHAGWRGLAAGIIPATIKAMNKPAVSLLVWLGPAIGPRAFEVGDDVYQAFTRVHADNAQAFSPGETGHWWANLYELARLQLARLGVLQVYGGDYCTYTQAELFYSYRRENQTGRMASFIWREQ